MLPFLSHTNEVSQDTVATQKKYSFTNHIWVSSPSRWSNKNKPATQPKSQSFPHLMPLDDVPWAGYVLLAKAAAVNKLLFMTFFWEGWARNTLTAGKSLYIPRAIIQQLARSYAEGHLLLLCQHSFQKFMSPHVVGLWKFSAYTSVSD